MFNKYAYLFIVLAFISCERQKHDIHGEIEALEPEAGDPHQDSGSSADKAPGRKCDPERHSKALSQQGGGVGADGQKSSMPQGNLTRKPGEDIEPHGSHNRNAGEIHHIDDVRIRNIGQDQ